MIGTAPGGRPLVGHGDKFHIVHAQAAQDRLLCEPQNVLEAHVRLHTLLKHLGDLVDISDVFDSQHLLDDGFQEVLLDFHTSSITDAAAAIVLPPANDLHGVVSVQQPVALGLVDDQVLIGVIIMHIVGHVKIYAADGVHQLAHGLPLDNDLVIRLKAHQLGDLLIYRLDALFSTAVGIIDGIDLFHIPGDVHHGVPGNGHDHGLLVRHIIGCQQHGVRIPAASGVPA